MPEPGFVLNGVLVIPGETRCAHWPQTCAAAQARCATAFPFCDFCLYGPIEEPTRLLDDAIRAEDAFARVAATEGERAERFREAITLAANA